MPRSVAGFLFLLAWLAAAPVAAIRLLFAEGFEGGDLCRFASQGGCERAIVFVSRQIPPQGSVYWSVPKDLPGVGPHSRFRPAAPGRLMVREADGTLRTLVDGGNPTAASLFLIDVSAPDVSYDGEWIAFAGLRQGSYPSGPNVDPSAWRIYKIRPDASGLTQLTFADQGGLDFSQFGGAGPALRAYDDTDPCFLPDGRLVFASTRWPARAQYSGVRASNLHVVDADGANLHRITSERNGAERPSVDPLTGRIVFTRWWRSHRFATDDPTTETDPSGGYRRHNGLTGDRTNHVGGPDNLWRNAWHLATIRPDGGDLAIWSAFGRSDDLTHAYGGSFTPDGLFLANYYPMANMTEAAGFGGVRRFERGAGRYEAVLGITYPTLDYVNPSNPTSYGIYNGSYATDALELPGGRLLVSWTPDVFQDYGLYTVDRQGGDRQPLLDFAGTSELRSRLLGRRPLPPILVDQAPPVVSLLPPTAAGPYDQDGTFSFDARNVYANAPVDFPIADAPAVGSAATIRFFLDHQRTSPGSFPNLDWPIQLGEAPVAADGSTFALLPAHVPLFEQLHSATGTTPLTRPSGAAHVTGMNYAPSGAMAACLGCHAGHSLLRAPADAEEARWSNLAPGGAVTVSSSRDPNQNRGVVDRRVLTGEIWRNWTSSPSQAQNGQWVLLRLPAAVRVRTVRLYNVRFGGEANSTLQVRSATVRLYADEAATQEVASLRLDQNLAVAGTDFAFAQPLARAARVELHTVTGTFYGAAIAGLGEIELIAKGE